MNTEVTEDTEAQI